MTAGAGGPTAGAGRSQLEVELREQGRTLAARTELGWESAERAAALLRRDDVDYLLIAARGSSDNAARYAQYLFGTEAQLAVSLAAPWLFSSPAPPRIPGCAVLAISQSGRSPDIIGVVAEARAQGRPTIAITNDLTSPLADAVEVVVPLLAGAERSVAATKTYTASLHAVAQVAHCLAPARGDRDWFDRLPSLVEAFVDAQLAGRDRFDPLDRVTYLTAVGRGWQFATAHETALKIRELSAIPAEAFSAADLAHGPVAALGPTSAIWVLNTAGRAQPDVVSLQRLVDTVATSVVVSDDDDLLDLAAVRVAVPPGLPPWVAPLLAVVPGQAAAMRLGELRGVNLDAPHGLSKVTLTS
jgi:glucosamine--fructose-6-phosphate aminotransferase (isomerizing)